MDFIQKLIEKLYKVMEHQSVQLFLGSENSFDSNAGTGYPPVTDAMLLLFTG